MAQRIEGELEQEASREAKVTGNQTKLTLCSVKDHLFLRAHSNLPVPGIVPSHSWGASGWPHGVTMLCLALDASGVRPAMHGNIGPLEEREGGKETGRQGSI